MILGIEAKDGVAPAVAARRKYGASLVTTDVGTKEIWLLASVVRTEFANGASGGWETFTSANLNALSYLSISGKL